MDLQDDDIIVKAGYNIKIFIHFTKAEDVPRCSMFYLGMPSEL